MSLDSEAVASTNPKYRRRNSEKNDVIKHSRQDHYVHRYKQFIVVRCRHKQRLYRASELELDSIAAIDFGAPLSNKFTAGSFVVLTFDSEITVSLYIQDACRLHVELR